jgi:hypothetical protein
MESAVACSWVESESPRQGGLAGVEQAAKKTRHRTYAQRKGGCGSERGFKVATRALVPAHWVRDWGEKRGERQGEGGGVKRGREEIKRKSERERESERKSEIK